MLRRPAPRLASPSDRVEQRGTVLLGSATSAVRRLPVAGGARDERSERLRRADSPADVRHDQPEPEGRPSRSARRAGLQDQHRVRDPGPGDLAKRVGVDMTASQPRRRRRASTASGPLAVRPDGLEAGRLAVVAPLGAQGVADLAERGLGADRVEHRGDHVASVRATSTMRASAASTGAVVAVGPARAEHAVLLALDLVGDPQDLQRLLDGRGVAR